MKTEERQWIEVFKRIDSMMQRYIAFSANSYNEERIEYAQRLQQAVIDLGTSIEQRKVIVANIRGGKNDDLSEQYYEDYLVEYDSIVHLLEQYCELIYQFTVEDSQVVIREINKLAGKISLALRFNILVLSREALFPSDLRDKHVYDALYDASIETGNVYPIQLGSTVCHVKYRHSHSLNDIAIVSQGPIDYQNDFTMETMYYYRSLYPKVKLVVSTWKGEVTDEFRWKMESIDVDIVENDKPHDPGAFNIYMQFGSSRGGIIIASADDNIRYILKTRNDQRFFHPDFLLYLRNLIRQYPAGEKAKERLIYLGEINSMFSIPFRLADFMLFGNKEMMMAYWSEDMEKKCIFQKPILKNNVMILANLGQRSYNSRTTFPKYTDSVPETCGQEHCPRGTS